MAHTIYVINLDEDTERYQATLSQLTGMGLDCERVSAIKGSELSPQDRQDLYSEAKNQQDYHKGLGPGELGCYLSHRETWKRIVSLKLDFAIVLEDDVGIDPLLVQAIAVIADLKNWDYIKLTGPRQRRRVVEKLAIDETFCISRYDKVPVSALGQAISYRGAQMLLANSLPIARPIDVDLQHYWEKKIDVIGLEPGLIDSPPAFESSIDRQDAGTPIRKAKTNVWRKLRFGVRYRWGALFADRNRPPLTNYTGGGS